MSSQDTGLLRAGLMALTHSSVSFNDDGIPVSDVHRWLVAPGAVSSDHTRPHQPQLLKRRQHGMHVYVTTLGGKTMEISCEEGTTIDELKAHIAGVEGIPTEDQRLMFAGKRLEDDESLADYNIQRRSTIHLVVRLHGGDPPVQLNPKTLDPRYDYDFTNVQDTRRVFYRGGPEIYTTPCRWKRYALAVLGKYASDQWLGATGDRKSGEWPVSFHGTGGDSAKSISEIGFQLSEGKRFAFGRGIYTTPDVDVAAAYAMEFDYQGQKYKVVLQNRVSPRALLKLDGDIWLTPNETDVRPYGILFKRV